MQFTLVSLARLLDWYYQIRPIIAALFFTLLLSVSAAAQTAKFTLQLASCDTREEAESMVAQLLPYGINAVVSATEVFSLVIDGLATAVAPATVSFDVAVFEVESGALLGFGDEPDLDFAGVVGIGLRADVPADDDPVRRLERENPGPATLAAVLPRS